jgi:hypothetical protein
MGRSMNTSVPMTARYGISICVWGSDAVYAYKRVGIITTEAKVETAVIEMLSATSAPEK